MVQRASELKEVKYGLYSALVQISISFRVQKRTHTYFHHSFIHSFILDIYIAPSSRNLLRGTIAINRE